MHVQVVVYVVYVQAKVVVFDLCVVCVYPQVVLYVQVVVYVVYGFEKVVMVVVYVHVQVVVSLGIFSQHLCCIHDESNS